MIWSNFKELLLDTVGLEYDKETFFLLGVYF